jgi:hypothetical protein
MLACRMCLIHIKNVGFWLVDDPLDLVHCLFFLHLLRRLIFFSLKKYVLRSPFHVECKALWDCLRFTPAMHQITLRDLKFLRYWWSCLTCVTICWFALHETLILLSCCVFIEMVNCLNTIILKSLLRRLIFFSLKKYVLRSPFHVECKALWDCLRFTPSLHHA